MEKHFSRLLATLMPRLMPARGMWRQSFAPMIVVFVHTYDAARVWWFKSDDYATATWMQGRKGEEKNDDREEKGEGDETHRRGQENQWRCESDS